MMFAAATLQPEIVSFSPAVSRAAGGSSITIQGRSLTNDQNDAATVSFAGVPASSITSQVRVESQAIPLSLNLCGRTRRTLLR